MILVEEVDMQEVGLVQPAERAQRAAIAGSGDAVGAGPVGSGPAESGASRLGYALEGENASVAAAAAD